MASVLLLALTALPVGAFDGGASGRRDNREERQMDQDSAASIAREATGGRVLGIQRGRSNGDDYRVRVLTPDGTVRTLQIDPRSGRVRR